eukprot:CCRYP_010023-RA/>CCRYP_010023-RA protein AED:0.37 eAED:0.36 QI:0/0/0/1/1/1/2/0/274
MTKPGFDLILGSNTLKELGIVLNFWTKEITVDDISLPMRDINKLKTRAAVERAWTINNSIYQDTSKEPQSTLEATKRLIHILDAKYDKADLRAIVKDNCTHLSVPEQTKLLEFLQEFEELFSRKLGDWDCKQVSLQLKEGAQPYHGKPFPIPKKHVETTKREVQRLCDLGVLKWQDDSEWVLPTFIVPKKDNTLQVVSNFREVNKWVGSLEDHLNKLRRVFIGLQDAGLTVNARKSSLCAVETEYLGYMLSRDGIKPQPKKAQAILALTPPQNV